MVMFYVLLLIYPKRIKQLFTFAKDDRFIIVISVITMILGLLNVLLHNVWTTDWRLIITLFGWSSLLKGITQFAFPKIAWDWMEKIDFRWFQFMLFLMLVLGIILLNQAYQWVPF